MPSIRDTKSHNLLINNDTVPLVCVNMLGLNSDDITMKTADITEFGVLDGKAGLPSARAL